ncbi:MAG: hypothetical protein U0235_10435 [Polyangiaceae bacterium]
MATKRVSPRASSSTLDANQFVTRAEFVEVTGGLRDDIRAVGVVVERVDANVRALAEAIGATREGLTAQMNDLERRLSERISVLESAVRQNSADILKNSADILKNSEDIAALRVEVARLRHDFDRRPEAAGFTDLDRRVAAVEARVGVTQK